MSITLNQILALVGKLDDSPGGDTSRERFRQFLKENVNEVGQVRDYIEECLRTSGDQYNRALQDLVNYLGHFLGFRVDFGRYHGVQNEIGYDGHWKSPTGYHLVIEVKTTEVYAIKTSTLVGYVDGLISEKAIANWDSALGLYVVGRPDPEIRTLENAIIAERRTNQLRIISADSLLSLAEMMNEYDISHEDILAVIRPSGTTIDSVVGLMARLVAEPKTEEPPEKESPMAKPEIEAEEVASYWLTPVRSDEEASADEVIQSLVRTEKIYAFGERTPGRRHLKRGDWICFFATGKGVVAHAEVVSPPERKHHNKVRHPKKYPWVFRLDNTSLYLNQPTVLDAALRVKLDAFQGRDPEKSWAWFVQATRRISKHDFEILTKH
jgi:hypothetical protein